MVEMRMLGGLWRCMITVGVLVMAQPVSAQDCDKNILLAAVLGTFFATVVAALLITLIVFLACRHSNSEYYYYIIFNAVIKLHVP